MIGYYVHHHGAGHAQRFCAVREHLGGQLIGLGSGPRPRDVPASAWVALAHDATTTPDDPDAGGSLHWAPLHDRGLRQRTTQLAAWAQAHDPDGLVVDVSVEVALTARLLGLPTVVVAQHGTRADGPHELAYRSARAVAALWHEGQHPMPPGARHVVHVGPLSRFDARIEPGAEASAARPAGDRRQVLLMAGAGGHELDAGAVASAVDATAGSWDWDVLASGLPRSRDADADGVWAALGAADVVVAAASNNCIGEVAAARRPLIAVPQPRPFREQHAHAGLLAERGLATVLDTWPEASRWPQLLEQAAARGGAAWAPHHDGRGAQRFAAAIREALA